MRPIIGVTFKKDVVDNHLNNYTKAIEQSGGVPAVLFPDRPTVDIDEMNGLLLTGGGDIHPDFFGKKWHPALKFVDKARDELEIQLCRQALEADIPVFGICRGIQVMSVATGGNLYQDIPSEYPRNAACHTQVGGVDSLHNISIKPDSLLNQITGESVAEVNSAHHQAVNKKGEGFVAAARTADNIIEAMEYPSKRFVLGVQYHPERMLKSKDPEFRQHGLNLFEAFINAASC